MDVNPESSIWRDSLSHEADVGGQCRVNISNTFSRLVNFDDDNDISTAWEV
jgi:hypothetical protein